MQFSMLKQVVHMTSIGSYMANTPVALALILFRAGSVSKRVLPLWKIPRPALPGTEHRSSIVMPTGTALPSIS
jgi:hypothetical protein